MFIALYIKGWWRKARLALSGVGQLVVVAILAFLSISALSVAASNIEGVRLWRAPDHTRLVFDLSGPVDHKIFPLANPDRLVIDIPKASASSNFDDVDLTNTPIQKIRSGSHNERDLRVVLDMRKAVNPRSFVLKKNEQYGDRLVVDLYDRTQETEKTIEDIAENSRRNIVIAIDAGHGGEDPGASGPNRIREKKVVLAISRELKKLVDSSTGFKATLIRDGDYYIPLRKRTEVARSRRADLLISIHADAFSKPQANGASVFALSRRGATSETARYLAQRENRADLIGGAGSVSLGDKDRMLASVLLDLSMTATLSSSLDVGHEVLRSIGGITKLHKKRVEQAGFLVLKSPDIPSILVETGFISNPTEARRLNNRNYQKKMARAIFSGVKGYFTTNPPAGTLLAARAQQRADEHIIKNGDTLSAIALRYNVSVNKLLRHNGLKNTRIKIGQRIKIPTS